MDRYTDIPLPVRARLKARMQRREYDDLVLIKRDSVEGAYSYDPQITQMHFATGQVCGTVTRSAWAPQARERGLVYCEGEHCILVPTVCRNVSRITRRPTAADPLDFETAAGPATGYALPMPEIELGELTSSAGSEVSERATGSGMAVPLAAGPAPIWLAGEAPGWGRENPGYIHDPSFPWRSAAPVPEVGTLLQYALGLAVLGAILRPRRRVSGQTNP